VTAKEQMPMCIYTYMRIFFLHIYICIHIHTYIVIPHEKKLDRDATYKALAHTKPQIHVYIHAYMYTQMYIYVFIHIHIYIYIYEKRSDREATVGL